MLTLDNYLTFAKGEEPSVVLRNFWEPEDGFVWSKGKWCDLTFAFESPGKSLPSSADIMLDLDVFKNPEHLVGQNVLIYLNGLRIGSSFVNRRVNLVFLFDPKILHPEENVLTFDTPESASPSQFGSNDTRVLGVQLFSIQVRKAS